MAEEASMLQARQLDERDCTGMTEMNALRSLLSLTREEDSHEILM